MRLTPSTRCMLVSLIVSQLTHCVNFAYILFYRCFMWQMTLKGHTPAQLRLLSLNNMSYKANVIRVSCHFTFNFYFGKSKKVKSSRTRYWTFSPELIPVHRLSAWRWLFKSPPTVGCHYFPPGLQSPSQPWPSFRQYRVTVLGDRQINVNNWTKVVMKLVLMEIEPTTCWSQVQCLTATPLYHLVLNISTNHLHHRP